MSRPTAALLLSFIVWSSLSAQPPDKVDEIVPLPSTEVSSSSLELGAQFNPFANSLTKKVTYIGVSRLKEGSVAARAGLQNGDHVIEIDGIRLSDYKISEVPKIHVLAVNHQATLVLKVRRKTMPSPIDVTLIFREFDGSISWDISRSVLQKNIRAADDARKK